MADTSMEVVLGMHFLTLSNTDVVLQKGNLPGGLLPLQRPYLSLRRTESSIGGICDDGTGSKRGGFRSLRSHPFREQHRHDQFEYQVSIPFDSASAPARVSGYVVSDRECEWKMQELRLPRPGQNRS